MVSLDTIELSNERIKSVLKPGLVAVFVGATNGVGETTVKQFAKHAAQPRVYIIGRSEEAGNCIAAECKALNPRGTFTFLKRETSLMRAVDETCNEITSKEHTVNLLFLSVGTLQRGTETEEGLHYPAALTIYGRNRFISNLLPLIRRAECLRRVVSVYGATFEGQINMADFQGWNLGRIEDQGHTSAITTLAMETHHKLAPEVSFIHNFPGAVESGIARGSIGWLMRLLKTIWSILGPLVHIPLPEAGDRHVFLCTSARFPAGSADPTSGVPLPEESGAARGTDGRAGSGVYSIDADGESASPKIENMLAKFRGQGLVDRVWENLQLDISGALANDRSP